MPSGESFIRQFIVGQNFFQTEFGKVCQEVSNRLLKQKANKLVNKENYNFSFDFNMQHVIDTKNKTTFFTDWDIFRHNSVRREIK